jgi:hypothetical protein
MQLLQVATELKRLEIEQAWALFFQVFGIVVLPIVLLFQIRRFLASIYKVISSIWVVFSVIAIANYLGLASLYPLFTDFADPAEANVASVAWLFQNQQPVYPALDAAERYINNYGPFVYIVQGFFLNLLRPSFFSVKIPGSLAGISTLVLVFLLLKQNLKWKFAIIGCAYASLGLLALTSATGLVTSSFWVRPDSLLLFFTTLGLFTVVRGDRAVAVLGSSIALGISTNLKITAFLHFLPIYVLLLFRFGLLLTLVSVIGSAFIAISPFVIFSQLSLTNYVAWLQQVRQKGINDAQVVKNLLWTAFIALPVAIGIVQLCLTNLRSFKKWIWQTGFYSLSLIIGVGVTAFLGATRGALENNMLPFVPVILYLAHQLWQQFTQSTVHNPMLARIASSLSVSAILAFVISITIAIYSTESVLIPRIVNPSGSSVVEDLHRFVKAHPGSTIGMGFGSNYPLTTYRPALVFAGNSYLLDSASLMEMQASGLNNTPAKTLDALKTCRTQIWLIPKDQKPFEVFSYYPPLQKLFSAKFRETFLQTYDRQEQTEFYDAWRCKTR